jgi:hypothetical protein
MPFLLVSGKGLKLRETDMPKYRVPSEILWHNDGWKEIDATSPNDALGRLREQGFGPISLSNVQIEIGGKWAFASETPDYLGGYRGDRAERL